MKFNIVIITLLVVVAIFSCKAEQDRNAAKGGAVFANISVDEAHKMLAGSGDYILLDIRTPGEFASGYIEGAINIDYYESNYRAELAKLDRDKVYIIYCRSGNRSGKSLSIMKSLGFKTVYNVLGGINRWKSNGYRLVQ